VVRIGLDAHGASAPATFLLLTVRPESNFDQDHLVTFPCRSGRRLLADFAFDKFLIFHRSGMSFETWF
jgi:hypothetical protein